MASKKTRSSSVGGNVDSMEDAEKGSNKRRKVSHNIVEGNEVFDNVMEMNKLFDDMTDNTIEETKLSDNMIEKSIESGNNMNQEERGSRVELFQPTNHDSDKNNSELNNCDPICGTKYISSSLHFPPNSTGLKCRVNHPSVKDLSDTISKLETKYNLDQILPRCPPYSCPLCLVTICNRRLLLVHYESCRLQKQKHVRRKAVKYSLIQCKTNVERDKFTHLLESKEYKSYCLLCSKVIICCSEQIEKASVEWGTTELFLRGALRYHLKIYHHGLVDKNRLVGMTAVPKLYDLFANTASKSFVVDLDKESLNRFCHDVLKYSTSIESTVISAVKPDDLIRNKSTEDMDAMDSTQMEAMESSLCISAVTHEADNLSKNERTEVIAKDVSGDSDGSRKEIHEGQVPIEETCESELITKCPNPYNGIQNDAVEDPNINEGIQNDAVEVPNVDKGLKDDSVEEPNLNEGLQNNSVEHLNLDEGLQNVSDEDPNVDDGLLDDSTCDPSLMTISTNEQECQISEDVASSPVELVASSPTSAASNQTHEYMERPISSASNQTHEYLERPTSAASNQTHEYMERPTSAASNQTHEYVERRDSVDSLMSLVKDEDYQHTENEISNTHHLSSNVENMADFKEESNGKLNWKIKADGGSNFEPTLTNKLKGKLNTDNCVLGSVVHEEGTEMKAGVYTLIFLEVVAIVDSCSTRYTQIGCHARRTDDQKVPKPNFFVAISPTNMTEYIEVLSPKDVTTLLHKLEICYSSKNSCYEYIIPEDTIRCFPEREAIFRLFKFLERSSAGLDGIIIIHNSDQLILPIFAERNQFTKFSENEIGFINLQDILRDNFNAEAPDLFEAHFRYVVNNDKDMDCKKIDIYKKADCKNTSKFLFDVMNKITSLDYENLVLPCSKPLSLVRKGKIWQSIKLKRIGDEMMLQLCRSCQPNNPLKFEVTELEKNLDVTDETLPFKLDSLQTQAVNETTPKTDSKGDDTSQPMKADIVPKAANLMLRDSDIVSRDSDIVTRDSDIVPMEADIVPSEADIVSREADIVAREADIVSREADILSKEAETNPIQVHITSVETDIQPMEAGIEHMFLPGEEANQSNKEVIIESNDRLSSGDKNIFDKHFDKMECLNLNPLFNSAYYSLVEPPPAIEPYQDLESVNTASFKSDQISIPLQNLNVPESLHISPESSRGQLRVKDQQQLLARVESPQVQNTSLKAFTEIPPKINPRCVCFTLSHCNMCRGFQVFSNQNFSSNQPVITFVARIQDDEGILAKKCVRFVENPFMLLQGKPSPFSQVRRVFGGKYILLTMEIDEQVTVKNNDLIGVCQVWRGGNDHVDLVDHPQLVLKCEESISRGGGMFQLTLTAGVKPGRHLPVVFPGCLPFLKLKSEIGTLTCEGKVSLVCQNVATVSDRVPCVGDILVYASTRITKNVIRAITASPPVQSQKVKKSETKCKPKFAFTFKKKVATLNKSEDSIHLSSDDEDSSQSQSKRVKRVSSPSKPALKENAKKNVTKLCQSSVSSQQNPNITVTVTTKDIPPKNLKTKVATAHKPMELSKPMSVAPTSQPKCSSCAHESAQACPTCPKYDVAVARSFALDPGKCKVVEVKLVGYTFPERKDNFVKLYVGSKYENYRLPDSWDGRNQEAVIVKQVFSQNVNVTISNGTSRAVALPEGMVVGKGQLLQ